MIFLEKKPDPERFDHKIIIYGFDPQEKQEPEEFDPQESRILRGLTLKKSRILMNLTHKETGF